MGDIFQIAMQIEKNGEGFYRRLSEKFKENNKEISELYSNLADEEVNHYNTFLKEKYK